jgi:ABC-type branched-subunit amino acid transport system substrate-binding protein
MNLRIARALPIALTLLLATGVAACGKADDDGGGGGSGGSGEVKTGPGVTADTITLGQITDLSGVFAPLATAFTQAQELFWKQQNAAGDICGRKVKLINKDAAYDVQKAVSLYRDTEPDIAAVSQIVGSPIIAALLPTFEQDSMLAVAAAWPPAFLDAESVAIVGASYDLEAINGIEWLMENKGLKKGDSIGDLYFEGDFGEGGLIGVKYAAEKHGLKVVEQKIKATDEDMSGAAAKFKREGVKAIWVTTAPGQLASLAGVAKSIGLDVPIGTNGPVFAPQLLKTPVGDTLAKNVTVFNSGAVYASDNPEVRKLAQAYEKAYPKGRPAAGRHHRLQRGAGHEGDPRQGLREQGPLARGAREGVPLALRRRHAGPGGRRARLHEARAGVLEVHLRARRRQERPRWPEDRRRRAELRDGAALRAQGRIAPPPPPPRPRRPGPPGAGPALRGIFHGSRGER